MANIHSILWHYVMRFVALNFFEPRVLLHGDLQNVHDLQAVVDCRVVAAHQLCYLHERQLHFMAHEVNQAVARFRYFAVAVLALHLTQANACALSHLLGVVVKLSLSVHWLVVGLLIALRKSSSDRTM